MRAAYVQLIHYFKISVDITPADVAPLHAFLVRRIDDFIVNISKILHMQNVIALMLQKRRITSQVTKGRAIADMGMVVRRNTANIHIGFAGMQRHKFFFLFGERIINFNSHSNCSLI